MKLLEELAEYLATIFNGREKVSLQTYIPDSSLQATLDLSLSSSFKILLTDNPTLVFTNPTSGGVTTILLKQDSTGNRVVTFPGNVLWQGGVVPTFSVNPNKIDIVTIYYDNQQDIYLGSAITDYA